MKWLGYCRSQNSSPSSAHITPTTCSGFYWVPHRVMNILWRLRWMVRIKTCCFLIFLLWHSMVRQGNAKDLQEGLRVMPCLCCCVELENEWQHVWLLALLAQIIFMINHLAQLRVTHTLNAPKSDLTPRWLPHSLLGAVWCSFFPWCTTPLS